MMKYLSRLILLSATLLLAAQAHASVNCYTSASNVSGNYVPSAGTNTYLQGSITVTCTRTNNEASANYWVGIDVTPSTLTLEGGSQTMSYQIYSNPSYSAVWDNFNHGVSGTLNFSSNVASTNLTYYFLAPSSNTGQGAGTYTGTAMIYQSDKKNDNTMSTASISPLIYVVPQCQFSSAPGPINLNYTSFSPTAVSASTNFGVNCTVNTCYTIELDASSGTLLGLNYNLALSATSGTGTAAQQVFSVTASIPAKQSGQCGTGTCSGSATRTLTISY